ncbi:MAG: hypothetical protein IIY36_02125 [Lachnospiraceae bacterium]|nr:hypothetical protein [Lachnospiraceae bacterium]
MDELIRSGGGDYERYEKLVLERDRLEKEAIQIECAWLREFGQLMTDLFEEKIECIKVRKMIAFYQAAANRGEQADQEEMIAYLQRELAEYYTNLRDMLKRNEAARKGRVITEYEEKRIRALYRWIAKRLHPDTHPGVEDDPDLLLLWDMASAAYRMSDLKRLMDVEMLVQKALAESGGGPAEIEVPDIALRIEELEEEIREIRTTEPYIWGEILDDEEACAAKKAALEKELNEYREYRAQLEEVLAGLMR